MSLPQPPTTSPRDRYQDRADHWSLAARAALRVENGLGWARAVCFIAAVVVAALALDGTLSPWWTAAAGGLFVVMGYRHEAVRRGRRDAELREAYARRGLARLQGSWRGTGATGIAWSEVEHLYARDLDIFGDGSVFQMANTAVTAMGEAALARWLQSAAPIGTIGERQDAVRELAADYQFREDLAATGGGEWRLRHERLARWAQEPSGPVVALRLGLAALVAANGAALWAFAIGRLPGAAALVTFSGMAAAALALRDRVSRAVAGVDEAARDLCALGRLLTQVERRRFEAPLLRRLQDSLAGGEGVRSPASAIRALERWANLAASTKNQLVAPLRVVTLWLTHVGLAIDGWRRRQGPLVEQWLSAVGEVEALCSLASMAGDHPEDAFPELVEGPEPLFEATAISHPLLPPETAVANDVSLGAETRALIVSGSNMSGKSTLLRAVGVNAVLALAGGSVRARRLRLTPLAVGASIVVSDSLADGRSRFYAEILRLKAIMARAEGGPVLFLIDEILHGTNSHDRRIGTEAVVRGLLDRGAIGMITTHDLALTAIAEVLGRAGRNAHFGDAVADGRLVFDYRLRPGVVERSNALQLMREVGLPVDTPEGDA